jgi:23S rRNA pseudouridine1911/1915/1917 synthase
VTKRFVAESEGRADKLVGAHTGASRKALAQLFDDGAVRVNGKRAKKGLIVARGDVIELAAEPVSEVGLRPVPQAELPLEVVHEDARVVGMNKAPGVASHPLRAGETGTLANALVARYPECAGAGADPREAGLAHRLDAGTSGVIVAARDRAAWDFLRNEFHEGRARKEYLALVVGVVTQAGEIEAPIAHDAGAGGVVVCEDPDVAAKRGALAAKTSWVVEGRYGAFTLLRCIAHTGRMHQLRAHLAHVGTPVVGDTRYGIAVADAPAVIGHFLHAARLVVAHPEGGMVDLTAPLPADRVAALR